MQGPPIEVEKEEDIHSVWSTSTWQYLVFPIRAKLRREGGYGELITSAVSTTAVIGTAVRPKTALD